jgi:hypothetical protein
LEANHVRFLSYAGNDLHNLQSFAPGFRELFLRTGLTELDCGVEVNGNFNDSYRWVRSSTGHPPEKLDRKTGKVAPALYVRMVRWILFDLPEDTSPYLERRNYVLSIADALNDEYSVPTSCPESFMCDNSFEVMTYFESVRARGFEGVMVKSLNGLYEKGKRTDSWLKLKPKDTADGKIESINEAISEDGTPLGRAGSIGLRLEDGSFASPHGIPHDLGRDMWEHPAYYLGQWAEFDYMEIDRRGGYRHPTFKRLREAK